MNTQGPTVKKKSKRVQKEMEILDAAEKVFSKSGFENAKMMEVAKEVGVSKGTIYFYFDSKENLYMAITYRAFQGLIDLYNEVIMQNKDKSGLDSVMAGLRSYLEFCEENPLYSEVMLHYLAFVQSTDSGTIDDKLSAAMKDSIYFQKVHSIQSVAAKLIIGEISRGFSDGSIKGDMEPQFLFLNAWALTIGFQKLNNTIHSSKTTIMGINVDDWREHILLISKKMIEGK